MLLILWAFWALKVQYEIINGYNFWKNVCYKFSCVLCVCHPRCIRIIEKVQISTAPFKYSNRTVYSLDNRQLMVG